MYEFLERELEWNIHVISYNNGGYYNWHKDTYDSNIFTFNLILNKPSSLKGGNMLFYDKKLIEVENMNNFMVVFPAYVSHAITPLCTENNKDVSFLEQRFSIQFWVRFKK
jgi:Rps23 Pro-64 3,4-dihydroxylase Tpa1-like proline 4-hydroxylase